MLWMLRIIRFIKLYFSSAKKRSLLKADTILYAPVAQLDRVSASEAEGRAFESRRVHHFSCFQEIEI